MDTNRVKQTARKTTGGKTPSPKKGVLSSPGGGEASKEGNDKQDDAQRGPLLTKAHVRIQLPAKESTEVLHASIRTRHTPELEPKLKRKPFAISDDDMDLMWTAPISNIRGGHEEEEEDELRSAASSFGVPGPSTVAGVQPNGHPKCERCSTMKVNPVCEPYPGSKKCEKCYRDHKNCSWIGDVSSPSSPNSNTSPKKKKVSHKRKHPKGEGSQPVDLKCTRCASFANSPICERSDDPNDSKCKKCRRDKQSCSFAPFGKPSGRRKRTVSEGAAGETSGTEGNKTKDGVQRVNSEPNREANNKATESTHAKKSGTNDKTADTRTEAIPEKQNESMEGATPRVTVTIGSEPMDEKKRKQDATLAEKGGGEDGNPARKKIRSDTTMQASTSDATAPATLASSGLKHRKLKNFKPAGQSLGGKARKEAQMTFPNGSESASTPVPASLPRVISLPQIKGQLHDSDRRATLFPSPAAPQPSNLSYRSATGTRAPERGRALAVIERELSAAEHKARSHLAIAQSYLRDAEKAEQEISQLKEELIAAVRRDPSLGGEGTETMERRRLIEMLSGQEGA